MSAKILVAASPGGHLELLLRLFSQLPREEGVERVWVTVGRGRAADVAEQTGDRVLLVSDMRRTLRTLGRNARAAARIVAQERPDVVLTSGAGAVLPLCALARARGARLLFVETMARVEDGSGTGRLLRRLAQETFVQWPEGRASFPDATVCRPLLLEELPREPPIAPPAPGRHGTLAVVGTHGQPFDRFVAAVEQATRDGLLPEPVFVQTGTSQRTSDAFGSAPLLRAAELAAALEQAEIVVCHAGAGFVAQALRAGRRPLVMDRRLAHDEHVDDHQAQLVRKLGALDLVVPLEQEISAAHLAAARRPLSAPAELFEGPRLADAVGRALREAIAP